MSLTMTTAQIATLKTYLTNDPDGLGFAAKISVGDVGGLVTLLNGTTPAYSVLDPKADANAVLDAIIEANYTPAAPISTANYLAAAEACADKQNELFLLLQRPNQTTFDATRPNNVAGLKDATTALPSKADLSNQTGGWTQTAGAVATVPMRLCRLASYVEKLFAIANTSAAAGSAVVPAMNDGTSAAGTAPALTGVGAPALMTYQGPCSAEDVQAALK